ncbi:hypothetical protein QBC34DRAFT_54511 [Podospora aff. communis PSN243]|uniref:Uncharacterized protein n=1 Tax=Podospora aff. communis PSN243 TaxID=3040156 RepID=A0AAV9GUM8_9PEZI|nr:hypothetical protein QBC34DRAFT_54511 [Podospora aff. communis PSN243]
MRLILRPDWTQLTAGQATSHLELASVTSFGVGRTDRIETTQRDGLYKGQRIALSFTDLLIQHRSKQTTRTLLFFHLPFLLSLSSLFFFFSNYTTTQENIFNKASFHLSKCSSRSLTPLPSSWPPSPPPPPPSRPPSLRAMFAPSQPGRPRAPSSACSSTRTASFATTSTTSAPRISPSNAAPCPRLTSPHLTLTTLTSKAGTAVLASRRRRLATSPMSRLSLPSSSALTGISSTLAAS